MTSIATIQRLSTPSQPGHPWVRRADLGGNLPGEPCVATLLGSDGEPLGSGLFDPKDPIAAWRRFSLAADSDFDAAYLTTAIHDALGRRSDDHCQRLVAAEADYLPGLEVDLYEDVLTIRTGHPVVEAVLDDIVACLQEACQPREIVFLSNGPRRTLSGQNLKARWIEVDGIAHRLDLLNAEKPCIYLDQREQHALVGSLCEGRSVLDGFAHSGAFALQATRAGAAHVVAVDSDATCVKSIGAQAEKNHCFVETIEADVGAFLGERSAGELDAIILDPPPGGRIDTAAVEALHVRAFSCLPEGGLLATYCRSRETPVAEFENCVARAAAAAGREARIFTRTAQPFDFPVLLNFSESHYLKGLILQVE